MKFKDVNVLFLKFSQSIDNPLSKISFFINEKVKPIYYQEKEKEFKKEGHSNKDAYNRARQSWVVFIGRILERFISQSLEQFCDKHELKITRDKLLKHKEISKELDLVRRAIEVHFGEYSLLPDADIIIYKYNEQENSVKVYAILSVKNSFRERYSETPYWKLKLASNPNTASVKVFMVTPDNDDEISFSSLSNSRGPRKARIVMEYELDGIYLAKKNFDKSDKVKGIDSLENDLENCLK